MSYKLTEQGSATLANLFAVLAGILFTVFAVDLFRYAAATDAVESAVQQSLRCLTPSDAACTAVEPAAAAGEADWYRSTVETVTANWGRKYHYRAALIRQAWQASFDSYRIHKVPEPAVILNSGTAALIRYSPEFSRYEHRFGRVAMTADEQVRERRYLAGLFPGFDQNFESSRENRSIGQWHPIVRTAVGGRFQSQPLALNMASWSSDFQFVPSGGETEFVTPKIKVPVLDHSIGCGDPTGSACRISGAGQLSGGLSWREFAFLAVKPFAEVVPVNPGRTGSVGWGSRKIRAGLWIDLFDSEGNKLESSNAELRRLNHYYCLGGRSAEKVGSGRWYNMWLRGPAGSNGGSHSICPGGDLDHSGIAVPRGGSFQIHGILMAEGADLRARATFKYYIDQPDETSIAVWQTRTRDCGGEIPLAAADTPVCPAPTDCGFPSVARNLRCALIEGSQRYEPFCFNGDAAHLDPMAIALPAIDCSETVERLTCSETEAPAGSSCIAPGRLLCGWHKAVRASDIPVKGACSNSRTETFWCSGGPQEIVYRADLNYGPAADCPEVAARIHWSRLQFESLRAQGAASDPGLEPIDLTLFSREAATEFSPPRYENRLSAENIDPAAIETVRNMFQPVFPIYKRKDPNWRPGAAMFSITSPPGTVFPPGFIEQRVEISRSDSIELTEAFTKAYPFNLDSAFELPALNIDLQSCAAESAISRQPGVEDEIESRLRQFAAAENKAALDPSIQFDFSAEYLGIAQIAAAGPPACPKIIKQTKENYTNYTGRYLGRFSAEQIPPGCSSDPQCHRSLVFDALPINEARPSFDLTRAQMAGHQEIRRAVPELITQCEGAGCSKIVIDFPSLNTAEVTAVYALPLTFPVDLLIGAETVVVSHSARESLELSTAEYQDR